MQGGQRFGHGILLPARQGIDRDRRVENRGVGFWRRCDRRLLGRRFIGRLLAYKTESGRRADHGSDKQSRHKGDGRARARRGFVRISHVFRRGLFDAPGGDQNPVGIAARKIAREGPDVGNAVDVLAVAVDHFARAVLDHVDLLALEADID